MTTTVVRRIGRFLLPLATSLILLLVIWTLFLRLFPQIGPRVGKTPSDVWAYLVTSAGAPTARSLQRRLRSRARTSGAAPWNWAGRVGS